MPIRTIATTRNAQAPDQLGWAAKPCSVQRACAISLCIAGAPAASSSVPSGAVAKRLSCRAIDLLFHIERSLHPLLATFSLVDDAFLVFTCQLINYRCGVQIHLIDNSAI